MAFRLRIALLSLAISGVLLVGSGIVFLTIIQRVGLERVDREIRAVADSQLRGRQPGARWRNVERSLRFIYGEESAARLAIQVRDAKREMLFTSPSFPQEIVSLSPPVLAFRPRPTDRPDPGSNTTDEGRDSGDRPPSGEDLLTRLDTDADGRVSIEEFDGPPGDFDEVDTDGDGYVTQTEVALRRRPPRQKVPVFRTVMTSTGEWRVGFLGNEDIYLTIGVSLADLARETSRFRRAFLLATTLALMGLAAAGWWLAGRALRPVALLTRTAESVTAGGLDQRVPEVAADRELRRLVEVINSMLERLERSFAQAQRFSSDAAHELQTPLTVLQGELDNAIQKAAPGSDEQRQYSSLLEEVRRLKAVVHKLLLMARADAGRLNLHLEPVALADLLVEAIEDVEAIAPGVRVESAIAPGIHVLADPDLLNQVVRNMTGNAIKHGEPDGVIRFEVGVEGDNVKVTLANTGKSIPERDRDRIFDRFYRADISRNERVGGSGLGLSLAREIARAHGGDLELGPERAGMTVFVLTLPGCAEG